MHAPENLVLISSARNTGMQCLWSFPWPRCKDFMRRDSGCDGMVGAIRRLLRTLLCDLRLYRRS
jgi:hypothetical protein